MCCVCALIPPQATLPISNLVPGWSRFAPA